MTDDDMTEATTEGDLNVDNVMNVANSAAADVYRRCYL